MSDFPITRDLAPLTAARLSAVAHTLTRDGSPESMSSLHPLIELAADAAMWEYYTSDTQPVSDEANV